MEVNVDSIIVQPIPLTFKTPIIEVEADYGHPVIDAFMVVFVLIVAFGFKKAVDKYARKT
jgi:hypothetical protein|tara:strand:- start:152 stop:331 length:180 start_codon:yes stop_codon:yes gene_type:complete